MRFILYVAGILMIGLGGYVGIGVMGSIPRGSGTAASLAAFLAAMPWFGMVGTGLLFIVTAFILFHLKNIDEDGRRARIALERLADAVAPVEPEAASSPPDEPDPRELAETAEAMAQRNRRRARDR